MMRPAHFGIWRSRSIVRLLVGVLVLLCAGGRVSAAREESPETAAFWTTDRVHTIDIRITPEQRQIMEPTRRPQGMLPALDASSVPRPSTRPSTRPMLAKSAPPASAPATQPAYREGQRLEPNFYGLQFAYVKAGFECDGVALSDVGIKMRGDSSFNWARGGNNRPYKVDFNRFVDGQKFHGIKGFYLNNNAYDSSQIRETIAYESFRQLGVVAPRTTLARVYLTIAGRSDHEFLGVYTLVEEPDTKAFLKDHFDSAGGLLMKPWSIRGLPYMGEVWQLYELRYNSRTEPTELTARRTIDFIKLINYADDEIFGREIENYLNVDEYLRLLAGQVVQSNLDSFLFTGHNFYLYLSPGDDRFHFMPWDMNFAFGGFGMAASSEQQIQLSLFNPHSGEAKLVDRLLAVPAYNEQYRQIIRHFLDTHFNTRKLFPRMDELQTALAAAEATGLGWKAASTRPTTKPASSPPIALRVVAPEARNRARGTAALKDFITRRIASVNAQLGGTTEGFTPGDRVPPPRSAPRAPAARLK